MRDDSRRDVAVLGHLRAENAHAEAYLERLEPLAAALADDMSARLPHTEVGPPRLRCHSTAGVTAGVTGGVTAGVTGGVTAGVTAGVTGGRHVGCTGSGADRGASAWLYYSTRMPGDDYWRHWRRPVHPAAAAAANNAAAAGGGGALKMAAAAAAQPQSALLPGSGTPVACSLAAAAAAAAAAARAEADTARGNRTDAASQHDNGHGNNKSSTGVQLVLDEPAMAAAAGGSYWDVTTWEVSPDGALVALLVDTVGDERYELQVGVWARTLWCPVVYCADSTAGVQRQLIRAAECLFVYSLRHPDTPLSPLSLTCT